MAVKLNKYQSVSGSHYQAKWATYFTRLRWMNFTLHFVIHMYLSRYQYSYIYVYVSTSVFVLNLSLYIETISNFIILHMFILKTNSKRVKVITCLYLPCSVGIFVSC
jgi:hypothetical protein